MPLQSTIQPFVWARISIKTLAPKIEEPEVKNRVREKAEDTASQP
jgi:hypothetical protein